MTRLTRTGLTVVALAASLVALPARADHGRKEKHGLRPVARVAVVPARPAPVVVHVPAPVRPAPVVLVTAPHRAHWRHAAAVRELRHDESELAAARDRFYATWNGAPWTRARFESWYASRRAELDHRWASLEHRWH
jgi:hypothetical protein